MAQKNRTRGKARKKFWSEHDKRTYECPDCGRRETQLRYGFEVHHIDGEPMNNDLNNLIGLCRPCHNVREGKKPSVAEIELIQEQMRKQSLKTGTTPLVENKMEGVSAYKNADAACKPHMAIYKIQRRKYTHLKIDFNTAKGWSEDAADDKTPRLTEDAAEIADAIMRKYRGSKKPKNTNSALSTSYGADVISTPPLLPEVTENLATELRPIIMNEKNWEPWEPTI